MKKTYKMTPEELLMQKEGKRDELKKKWENNEAYVKLQIAYAETAKAEYLKRDEQAKAMRKRYEDGLEARREADALRGPFQQLEDTTTPEAQETLAKILELDTFYHDTMQSLARINNGIMGS